MNIEEEIEQALKNLDSIDFIPIFKKADTFHKAIKMLEQEHGEYILNIISTDEFVDYINKRYKGKINVYEVSFYTFELRI